MSAHREQAQLEEIGGKTYRAFLVRCWQEAGAENGETAWRFTLVQVGIGQTQRGKAPLGALVAYLLAEQGGTGPIT